MDNQSNSATFSITTVAGFNVLFTIRENDIKKAKDLLSLVEAFDKALSDRGIKPQVKQMSGFPKKEKDYTGDICPKDGGKLYHLTTKTGKDMLKCENGKYDFNTKTTVGCDFTAWGKNLKDADEQKKKWLAEKQKINEFDQSYGEA